MKDYKLEFNQNKEDETWGYNIIDKERDISVLHGEGYLTQDDIIQELSDIKEVLIRIIP